MCVCVCVHKQYKLHRHIHNAEDAHNIIGQNIIHLAQLAKMYYYTHTLVLVT